MLPLGPMRSCSPRPSHCGTELDTGATRANSKVADFLFYGICGGTGKPAFRDERARVTAAIFWMKTRGGWDPFRT